MIYGVLAYDESGNVIEGRLSRKPITQTQAFVHGNDIQSRYPTAKIVHADKATALRKLDLFEFAYENRNSKAKGNHFPIFRFSKEALIRFADDARNYQSDSGIPL